MGEGEDISRFYIHPVNSLGSRNGIPGPEDKQLWLYRDFYEGVGSGQGQQDSH